MPSAWNTASKEVVNWPARALIRNLTEAVRWRCRQTEPTGDIPVTEDSPESGPLPGKIDYSRPHSARIWNYWLGGKDNYPVDREVGDKFVAIFPGQVDIARHSRAFLGRAVRFLAGEAGVRQFLDIGTGLPTKDNTHQVAQDVAPESRIVYVDNDPLVLAHARALLTSTPQGACDYIDADLRGPGKILTEAARTLDFAQPIALIMLGILGHIPTRTVRSRSRPSL